MGRLCNAFIAYYCDGSDVLNLERALRRSRRSPGPAADRDCNILLMQHAPPVVRLLRLQGHSILEQLWLEEALFRAHPGNWFVVNDGAAQPAIVLGISGCAPPALPALLCLLACGSPIRMECSSQPLLLLLHGTGSQRTLCTPLQRTPLGCP